MTSEEQQAEIIRLRGFLPYLRFVVEHQAAVAELGKNLIAAMEKETAEPLAANEEGT